MSKRSRRKSAKKAKLKQKITWAVELRLQGWSEQVAQKIIELNNYTTAKRYRDALINAYR